MAAFHVAEGQFMAISVARATVGLTSTNECAKTC